MYILIDDSALWRGVAVHRSRFERQLILRRVLMDNQYCYAKTCSVYILVMCLWAEEGRRGFRRKGERAKDLEWLSR